MKKQSTNSVFAICILLFVVASVIYFEWSIIISKGIVSEIEQTFLLARMWESSGEIPQTAFYPPLMLWISRFLLLVGVPLLPLFFNSFFILLGVIAFYYFNYIIFRSIKWSFITTLLGVFNPYFIWTSLITRDTAGEFFFLVLVMISLCKLFFSRYEDNALNKSDFKHAFCVIIFGTALMLARVTGFFMVMSTLLLCLLFFIVLKKILAIRLFSFLIISYLLSTLLFCFYNYKVAGIFSLSTNSGYNIYIGNHDGYLHGHPHYDIDGFMESVRDRPVQKNEASSYTSLSDEQKELNYFYTKRGTSFIYSDPIGFIYRSLVKTNWHWFNFEKIPNYNVSASYGNSGKTINISKIDSVNLLPNLFYMIYKYLYIPLFCYSLFSLFQGIVFRGFFIFLGPMLGLWPVVVLTFPDTRFKISAEVFLVSFIAIAIRDSLMKKAFIKSGFILNR